MFDPASARPRPDLTFLSTRSARVRRTPAMPAMPAGTPAAVPATPPKPPAATPAASSSWDLDLSAPSAPTPVPPPASLDLSAPAAPPAAAASLDLGSPLAPPAAPASLDLGAPLTPPAAPAAPAAPAFSGSLLDLDDAEPEPPGRSTGHLASHAPGSAPPPAPGTASGAAPGIRNTSGLPSTSAQPVRELGPRIPDNGRAVLTPSAPTVALPRLISGIGSLTVTAAISDEVGEVSLGAAFFLADGTTSFLNPDSGQRGAPRDARMPLLVGSRRRFAQIDLDLRQVRHLERLLIVLHSVPRTPVTWGGTLVISTHAGDRIDVPLDPAEAGVALAAVSIYQVRGELVVRAELDAAASVREACVDFGYDRITWLDDRSPLG